ncbi:MAG: hypothetical protein KIT36_14230, partial [Alphaproteobacteria bacterium]|nr:hypothetical protein [Alphaproteobacteria bacterium]
MSASGASTGEEEAAVLPEDAELRWRAFDAWTTARLFAATLEGDLDDDAPWEAVTKLQVRGTSDVLDLALQYCESPDPKARARGLDVLAQIGAKNRSPESFSFTIRVDTAICRLADADPNVVQSAAWALAHLGGTRATTALAKLLNHA